MNEVKSTKEGAVRDHPAYPFMHDGDDDEIVHKSRAVPIRPRRL